MAVDTFIAYVGVYNNPADANADYELVKDLHTKENLIDSYDAAVIERRADGKVKITKKHETPTRVGGVLGGGVGLATGLVVVLFPFAAIGGGLLLATTAGGAVLGAVAGHAAAGMSRHDLKELGEHLDAGQAGLVVVGVSDMGAKIERSMKKASEGGGQGAEGGHRRDRGGRQGCPGVAAGAVAPRAAHLRDIHRLAGCPGPSLPASPAEPPEAPPQPFPLPGKPTIRLVLTRDHDNEMRGPGRHFRVGRPRAETLMRGPGARDPVDEPGGFVWHVIPLLQHAVRLPSTTPRARPGRPARHGSGPGRRSEIGRLI